MSARFDDVKFDGLTAARSLKLQVEAKTLGGNVVMVNNDGIIQAFDAGGSSRNVTLPTRAAINDGTVRIFHNISTAGENLVIKDAAAATILTVPSGSIGLVFASGTAEAPGTRGWAVGNIGGEDLTIADDLTVTGDLAVTGPSTLTGSVLAAGGGKFGGSTSVGIAFYGTTTVSQRASSAQNTTLVISNSIGTAAEAVMEEICNTLTALGLWKGAA